MWRTAIACASARRRRVVRVVDVEACVFALTALAAVSVVASLTAVWLEVSLTVDSPLATDSIELVEDIVEDFLERLGIWRIHSFISASISS